MAIKWDIRDAYGDTQVKKAPLSLVTCMVALQPEPVNGGDRSCIGLTPHHSTEW